MHGGWTIGDLARRTGASVKTLRFYSDEGLLPVCGRSRSGYRLYSEEHAARVDLIVALREAGVGLTDVRRLLRRDVTLEDLLRLRLGTVEAHIGELQRVAAALRGAIAAGATEEHLRRVTMVTRTSNDERRRVIAAFYEKVADGIPVDRSWVDGMIEASTPRLPDNPSAEQLDAWITLETMLEDPTFLACKRVNAADAWSPRMKLDNYVFVSAHIDALTATGEARARGVSPTSREALGIVERFTSIIAEAAGEPQEAAREHLRVKYDPRGARYWELVAVLKGEPPVTSFEDWRWVGEAFRHHAAARG